MRQAVALISSVLATVILVGCGGGGGGGGDTAAATTTSTSTATFIDSPYQDWNLKVLHKWCY